MTYTTTNPQPLAQTWDDKRPERCGSMIAALRFIQSTARATRTHCSDHPGLVLAALRDIETLASEALDRDDALRNQAGFPDV